MSIMIRAHGIYMSEGYIDTGGKGYPSEVRYVVATTDPLKFAPKWGANGFAILRNNPHVRAFSSVKPGCEHAGCCVDLFILTEIPPGTKIFEEVNYRPDKMLKVLQKLVKLLPLCCEEFPEIVIKCTIGR